MVDYREVRYLISLGIPAKESFLALYYEHEDTKPRHRWEYYLDYIHRSKKIFRVSDVRISNLLHRYRSLPPEKQDPWKRVNVGDGYKKLCNVEECYDYAIARGLCSYHYYRRRKEDSTFVQNKILPKSTSRMCSECGEKAIARGLCQKHYQVWYRSRNKESEQ